MSFFDSVKKSLGMSKDKRSGSSDPSNSAFDQFEFTFTEEKLGIGISKYTGVMPHIDNHINAKEELSCPVVTNFDAHKFDIQPGDLIVALEGNPVSSFDDFTTIIKAIGRPVRIRFLRRHHHEIGHGSATSVTATDKSSNAGGLNGMNIFRNLSVTSSAPSKATPSPTVVLSEEEKALRRERLSAAAQDRSKSWDKKLGQKKPSQSQQSNTVDSNTAEQAGPTHADTEKAIRKTKEGEVRIEQQMGYNPFRPHMSFSSGNGSGSVPASSSAAEPLSPGFERNSTESEPDEATVVEVDDAFAMLLSLGESEQELGRLAVQTVSRMIQNLSNAPEDVKLRSIRVNNKAFQSKVASVAGGAELLVAAGYEYVSVSGASAPNEEGELFLVHNMDAFGQKKLRYTLSRIQELLGSISGSASPMAGSSPRSS